MSNDIKAKFKLPSNKLDKIINYGAMKNRSDVIHNNIVWEVRDDYVIVGGDAKNRVTSFCTFEKDYFEDVEINGDPPFYTHISVERVEDSDIRTFPDFLDGVADSGMVELSLIDTGGDEDLADELKLEGELLANIRVEEGLGIRDSVVRLENHFDEDNNFLRNGVDADDQNPHTTQFTIDTKTIQHLIDVVQLQANFDYYPISIQDGGLHVNVADDFGSSIEGSLVEDIETEDDDFTNLYGSSFGTIPSILSGRIQLSTAPQSSVCVVREANTYTTRYMIGRKRDVDS